MFHNGENVQDVLLCEGRLVAAVKVVLLDKNLQKKREKAQETSKWPFGEVPWRITTG